MSDSPYVVIPDDRGRLWHGLMRFALIVPRRIESELQSTSGISFAEFGILLTFRALDDPPVRIGDLAEHTGLSFSRASRAVAGLERDGLLQREAAASDGRGYQVRATEAGLDLLERTIPHQARLAQELLLDRLEPQETARLADLFDDVSDRAAPPATRPAPGDVFAPLRAAGSAMASVDVEPACRLPADLFDALAAAEVGVRGVIEPELKARLGVPLSWFEAVRAVGRGTTRGSLLARTLGVTQAGAGKLLRRLVEAGHLAQREDPADARAAVYSLTESGARLLVEATGIAEERLNASLGGVLDSDELEHLLALLARVRDIRT
jgi:DNA-binding MarR family transcriptional regulator